MLQHNMNPPNAILYESFSRIRGDVNIVPSPAPSRPSSPLGSYLGGVQRIMDVPTADPTACTTASSPPWNYHFGRDVSTMSDQCNRSVGNFCRTTLVDSSASTSLLISNITKLQEEIVPVSFKGTEETSKFQARNDAFGSSRDTSTASRAREQSLDVPIPSARHSLLVLNERQRENSRAVDLQPSRPPTRSPDLDPHVETINTVERRISKLEQANTILSADPSLTLAHSKIQASTKAAGCMCTHRSGSPARVPSSSVPKPPSMPYANDVVMQRDTDAATVTQVADRPAPEVQVLEEASCQEVTEIVTDNVHTRNDITIQQCNNAPETSHIPSRQNSWKAEEKRVRFMEMTYDPTETRDLKGQIGVSGMSVSRGVPTDQYGGRRRVVDFMDLPAKQDTTTYRDEKIVQISGDVTTEKIDAGGEGIVSFVPSTSGGLSGERQGPNGSPIGTITAISVGNTVASPSGAEPTGISVEGAQPSIKQDMTLMLESIETSVVAGPGQVGVDTTAYNASVSDRHEQPVPVKEDAPVVTMPESQNGDFAKRSVRETGEVEQFEKTSAGGVVSGSALRTSRVEGHKMESSLTSSTISVGQELATSSQRMGEVVEMGDTSTQQTTVLGGVTKHSDASITISGAILHDTSPELQDRERMETTVRGSRHTIPSVTGADLVSRGRSSCTRGRSASVSFKLKESILPMQSVINKEQFQVDKMTVISERSGTSSTRRVDPGSPLRNLPVEYDGKQLGNADVAVDGKLMSSRTGGMESVQGPTHGAEHSPDGPMLGSVDISGDHETLLIASDLRKGEAEGLLRSTQDAEHSLVDNENRSLQTRVLGAGIPYRTSLKTDDHGHHDVHEQAIQGSQELSSAGIHELRSVEMTESLEVAKTSAGSETAIVNKDAVISGSIGGPVDQSHDSIQIGIGPTAMEVDKMRIRRVGSSSYDTHHEQAFDMESTIQEKMKVPVNSDQTSSNLLHAQSLTELSTGTSTAARTPTLISDAQPPVTDHPYDSCHQTTSPDQHEVHPTIDQQLKEHMATTGHLTLQTVQSSTELGDGDLITHVTGTESVLHSSPTELHGSEQSFLLEHGPQLELEQGQDKLVEVTHIPRAQTVRQSEAEIDKVRMSKS